MNVGRVIAVKCPLCGMSRRYRKDANPNEFFTSPIGDVLLIEEVGGKHRRTKADLDSGILRQGRGSARGRIEIKEAIGLEDLSPDLKRRIRSRVREILERLE